jgi:release factor glutamine methyltransferase
MTIQEARLNLQTQLAAVYENREAANITDWVMESLTGLSKSARLVKANDPLTTEQENKLSNYSSDLLRHRPVQYVLGESWFHGLRFRVNENVLIPRPETEELVDWIITENKDIPSLRILDIGTGSGCIPISLKKGLPQATVFSCDISEGALEVAKQNAANLEAAVHFIQQDILDASLWNKLPEVDIIVSNPPYIPENNKTAMHKNVLEHEPHLALFVSNDDPLSFYRAIAELSGKKLSTNGAVYAETHEDLGSSTLTLFREKGFDSVTLRRDLQEKDRMIKATAFVSH